MLTRENKLEIFENFIIDKKLKKQDESKISDSGLYYLEGDNEASEWTLTSGITGSNITRREEMLVLDYLKYLYSQNSTLKNWIKLKMATIFYGDEKKKTKKITYKSYESVDVFFKNIKSAAQELSVDSNSIEFYTEALKNSIDNGQEALFERLLSRKNTIINEMNLLKNNIKTYVDEEDVVKFYKLSKLPEKTLKLTWIKNYIRIIPTEVMEKKKKFDAKYVFDNYVILHFDKNDDSTSMTKKEIEKAKDPILFGVVKGSRKLFYVADWIDEYCDLTLDSLLEVLKMDKAKALTKTSIKKQIK